MSQRSVLVAGVAALASLAACTPAARPAAAPTSSAVPSSAASSSAPASAPTHAPSASASTSASGNGGGQGGSSSGNLPSWSGVDFAAATRTDTHCLPEVKKDEVMSVKFADLTGDGRDEALVTAACPSPTSQNPVAVFVYDGQDRKRPLKLLAAIGADHDLTTVKVTTHGHQVDITAEGRSAHTGLCCPDLRITETWEYSNGRLHRTASQQKSL